MPGALFDGKPAGVGPSSSRPGPRQRAGEESGLVSGPGEALFDRLPVDGVPPGREVVGPAVLGLSIVSGLPNGHAGDGPLVLPPGGVPGPAAEHLPRLAPP